MTIETASALYVAALAEDEAAEASGDPERQEAAVLALQAARRALDDARPGTSLDLTAFLLTAE